MVLNWAPFPNDISVAIHLVGGGRVVFVEQLRIGLAIGVKGILFLLSVWQMYFRG